MSTTFLRTTSPLRCAGRWFLLAALCLPLTGCFYSRELADTRRDIEDRYPEARFDMQGVVELGQGTFQTLGWLADLVPEPEADLIGAYLRDIRRVKVGVYEVEDLPPLDEVDLADLDRFRERDWELAFRRTDRYDVVWVLYRERWEVVRDVYVLVLNEHDLVLVRVQGYLNPLLEGLLDELRHSSYAES